MHVTHIIVCIGILPVVVGIATGVIAKLLVCPASQGFTAFNTGSFFHNVCCKNLSKIANNSDYPFTNDYKWLQLFNNRLLFFGCPYFATVNSISETTARNFQHLNFIIMQNLRNRVQLIGRLGQNPEVKTLTSGKKLTTFSVATTDTYRNSNGEKVEETQWHNIVAWGKVGEIAGEYLTKGQEVALEGKLTHRSYETNSGEKRYVTEINLNELVMMSGAKKA